MGKVLSEEVSSLEKRWFELFDKYFDPEKPSERLDEFERLASDISTFVEWNFYSMENLSMVLLLNKINKEIKSIMWDLSVWG